jgi:TolB-like protein
MMNQAIYKVLRFDRFVLDLTRGSLRTGETDIELRPKAFELLTYLALNAGRLVPKQELMDAVWRKVTVTDESLVQGIRQLRQCLGDDDHRIIKTVPRRGYLLDAATFASEIAAPAIRDPSDSDSPNRSSSSVLSLPEKPSIAVLPFLNLSDDPAQGYFVDGIVEEVTTALSRFSQLFVVARSSSFTYKGRDVDVQQVGRQLGVRYVVEGSIRKAADQVRITVQLINARSGLQLWAARFDGALGELFELQDRITAGLVSVIAPKIEQAEIDLVKRKPTDSLGAYDYYLQGLASFHQDTREANDEALRFFGKAVALDRGFAAAYGMAALCYVGRQWKYWMLDPLEEAREAAWLVERAAELGRSDPVALSAAGMALGLIVRDLDRAAVLLDRSLLLNPNFAASWVRSAWVRLFLGQFDLAIEHASRAMRLSPLDPLLVGMQTAIAFAHFCAGRNDQSAAWAEAAVNEQPSFAPALRVQAASSGLLHRMHDVSKALARLREINALVPISELRHFPFREPKYFAQYAEALRKAGYPE